MQTVRPPLLAQTNTIDAVGIGYRNCLLIDDSRFDRQIVTHLARKSGLELNFLETSNLQTARAILQTEVIDLVIVDYHLPDGSGLELAREVFDGLLGICTPLILMSGRGSETIVAEAFDTGCMAYLRKDDLTDGELRDVIERTFANFAAGRTLSMRSAQKQHDPGSLVQHTGQITQERLGLLIQRMRRQVKGLKTDLQLGDTNAALAQTLMLEEALETIDDISRVIGRDPH
ncbi:MAG: response regulator [Pseudomonadota bacterium]